MVTTRSPGSTATHNAGMRNAEKHLQQMEGRYRGLLEAAPDAMVVVNEGGEIVLLNLQAEKQFGYRRDELLGQKVKNIIPVGFAERLVADGLRSAEEALAQQIGTGIELTGRRKDGTEFPLDLLLSPLGGAEGILVTAAIRNISVRKEAEKHLAQMEGGRGLVEEALRESEERYRMLLDGIQDYAIFMMDPNGQIVSWNAGAERVKGYTADQIIGQNFSCFFPPDDILQGRPEAILRITAATGRHEEQGIRVRKDGSRFFASITFTALRDPAGNLRGFSEFSHALTESKESEAKYRGLLEAAPDAMVVVNERGEIVLLNLQAEKQFGYRRDELLGQKVKNIIPDGFAERLIADGTRTAAEALAQQIGTGIELTGQRKDGSEFPIELMLSPLESPEGILVTAAVRDISVRKDAERHLAQMEGRYRGLLEAAPDAMVVVNEGGEIVLLNLQAEKQFGYRRDELLGQKVKNIIPVGFAERLVADGLRSAEEALAQQIGTGIELTGRRKDETEFPIELMLSPLGSAEGILVTAAIRDISVRKAAEKHLGQMEGRYRGLLEAAPDAMVVVNEGGEIVLLNLQAEKQFGYRRDELLGQKVKNIIPEGFAERLIADGTRTAAEALAQQIGTGIELIGQRKDGSEFPLELMLSPLGSAEGILVTAAIRDISVRKAAEKHLGQMEGRYRGLLEAAPDAMVVVNEGGEIVLLNLQAEKQFGYRRDELLGQKVKNIIPEGFAERLIADGTRTAAEALAQQIGTGIELIGQRKDGSQFPIELMLSPLQSDEGILVTAAIRNISVRKAAEGQFSQLEVRYSTLLESAPDAILISGGDSRILMVNAETERSFGYSRAELIGQPVTMLMPSRFWETGAKFEPGNSNELRTRPVSKNLEFFGLRRDGSEFPIELTLRNMATPKGTVYFSAMRDVSERMLAIETLRASEERFRLLVNGIEDYALLTLDTSGRVATWNNGAERLKGFTSADILGQHFSRFYTAEAIAEGKPEAELRTAATQGRVEGEGWRLRKDGTRFWADVVISALRDDTGELRGFANLTRDVTARRTAEDALRLSEERHRMAVEVAQMGTWIWKIQPDEVTWSDEFRALFGLSSDATLTYDEITKYIHPDDLQRMNERVKSALEQGTPYDFEYRVIWPDASVHWIASRGRVQRDGDGSPTEMQGVIMDVTDRRQAQEALKYREESERRSAELMRSNDDLQQFAYVAAHDLQEPLRMVASYTQLLGQRYKGRLDADADEFIAFAVGGAHRMQLLIADLLAYCRVGTSGKEFQMTSSTDALDEALANLMGAVEESRGVITHDVLPDVMADRSQLTQLFQNIIGNAIKYRSTEPPRIHVSAKKNRAREWVFSMRDNGLGIDPQYFEKIFEMFQRLHRREEFSGTGIGLTLCKKIAERHGGRIWVEANAGPGSTFHLALPESRIQ
jgi:PAS domain S-box-containing protein